MTPLLVGCGLILLAGASALVLQRWRTVADRVYAVLILIGAAVALSAPIAVLRGAPSSLGALPGSLPGGPWAFGLDPLSAWFLIPVLVAGPIAGVFGLGYLAPERGYRPVAVAHGLFALLLVALTGVVTAQAMVPFLAAWEVMALCAYLLIMFEGDHAEVRRAGFIYIALTHVSTLALLAMFAALGVHADGRSFAALGAGNQVASGARTMGLIFAIVGFGLKAGAVPLHVWLPGAHASAPSHVSAVLSGVMLKMGIYGLLRVLLLLGGAPAWFGWILFGLGLVSGVLGVLWALGERDLKRVLAYSSVENVGLILLGLGVGTLGLAYGHPVVAVLGFTGALVHTLNHALFKSLLFLGAGAVLRATGTRVIDELGGLGRALPWTAVCFGVGSVAIVGLPPLNGFVSEWVTVQGLLAGAREPGLLALLVLGVAGVGLIGALALACFSRAAGGVFLGQPRQAREVAAEDWGLVAPMLALAAGCVTVGLFPRLVVQPALVASGTIVGVAGLDPAAGAGELLRAAGLMSSAWLLLVGCWAVFWYLRFRAARAHAAKHAMTWGCGYASPTARMQYTAGSLLAPIMLAYGRIAAPDIERGAAEFRTRSRDRVLDGVVLPLWRRTTHLARSFRPLQQAPVTRYLQYIVVTVVLLLGILFAAIVRRP